MIWTIINIILFLFKYGPDIWELIKEILDLLDKLEPRQRAVYMDELHALAKALRKDKSLSRAERKAKLQAYVVRLRNAVMAQQ